VRFQCGAPYPSVYHIISLLTYGTFLTKGQRFAHITRYELVDYVGGRLGYLNSCLQRMILQMQKVTVSMAPKCIAFFVSATMIFFFYEMTGDHGIISRDKDIIEKVVILFYKEMAKAA